MPKKNGFIAISLLYSFFLVFIILILSIMNNYSENRINTSVVMEDAKKYIQGDGDWGIVGKAGNKIMEVWSQNPDNIQMNISKTIPLTSIAPNSSTYTAKILSNEVVTYSFSINGSSDKITYGTGYIATYGKNDVMTLINQTTASYATIYNDLKGKFTTNIGLTNGTFPLEMVFYEIVDATYNNTSNSGTLKYKAYHYDGDGDDKEDVGIFTATDNYGTSYFVRGNSYYNYFKFADFWWRIVRINGDGSIRLIYQGISPEDAGYISSVRYNASSDLNEYLGFKYTVGEIHGNKINSNVKTQLDNWYTANLLSYENYIADSIFCNNRVSNIKSGNNYVSGGGIGVTETYYQNYLNSDLKKSVSQPLTPSLSCQKEDAFTTTTSEFTNGFLTYPIGLITMDEVILAGGYNGSENKKFYLKTNINESFMTMTPAYFSTNVANIYVVESSGTLNPGQIRSGYAVRPVINLKNDLVIEGTGTTTNPFTIGG